MSWFLVPWGAAVRQDFGSRCSGRFKFSLLQMLRLHDLQFRSVVCEKQLSISSNGTGPFWAGPGVTISLVNKECKLKLSHFFSHLAIWQILKLNLANVKHFSFQYLLKYRETDFHPVLVGVQAGKTFVRRNGQYLSGWKYYSEQHDSNKDTNMKYQLPVGMQSHWHTFTLLVGT